MTKRRRTPLDFTLVKRQVISEYLSLYGSPRDDDEWSLKNCLDLFRVYYIKYKERFGIDHPNMTNKTIRTILEEIPYIGDIDAERTVDFSDCISLEDYPDLIDAYFDSKFWEGCDYTMPHFMSGKIRVIKFFETLY